MQTFEKKHIFMLLAIVILVFSPIFLLILPNWNANNLYHTPNNWYVFVSGQTYFAYAVSFFFLFLAAFIIFIMNCKRISIYTGIVFVLLSVLAFNVAIQQFTSLSYDSIKFRHLLSKEVHAYSWDEIDQVIYLIPENKNTFAQYQFHFKDNNILELTENGTLQGMKTGIRDRLKEEGIEIERVYGN